MLSYIRQHVLTYFITKMYCLYQILPLHYLRKPLFCFKSVLQDQIVFVIVFFFLSDGLQLWS